MVLTPSQVDAAAGSPRFRGWERYRSGVSGVCQGDVSPDAHPYVAQELKNPQAANRLADSLVKGIESLATLPTRCPLHVPVRELGREYRRLSVGNYLIFFCASEADEVVTVARVLYGRRDVDKQLEQANGTL